jgi:hypothetical protein
LCSAGGRRLSIRHAPPRRRHRISGEPGIGLEVANWVIEKDLCGADTWAVEVVPNPNRRGRLPCMTLQTKRGILNHENLFFDDLIADKKYQFVYASPRCRLSGARAYRGGVPIRIT